MKNTIKIELYSENEITQESANEQIHAISDFKDGLFRPERCDTAEPLRERFTPLDISEPIRWLCQAGADFKFKRVSKNKLEGFISNRRFAKIWTQDGTEKAKLLQPKINEPRFLTKWCIWFSWQTYQQVGTETMKQFALEMFTASKSEYGFMTMETDQKNKNFLVRELPTGAISSQFVGDDPEYGIPGLYWLNLFGKTYKKWLGNKVNLIPAIVDSFDEENLSIQFSSLIEEAENQDVLNRERKAIQILGPENFFDIKNYKRRVLSPFSLIQ